MKIDALEQEDYMSVFKSMPERDLQRVCILLHTLSLKNINEHKDKDGKRHTHAQQRKTPHIYE